MIAQFAHPDANIVADTAINNAVTISNTLNVQAPKRGRGRGRSRGVTVGGVSSGRKVGAPPPIEASQATVTAVNNQMVNSRSVVPARRSTRNKG